MHTHRFERGKQIETLPDRIPMANCNTANHLISGSLNSREFYAVLAMHAGDHITKIKAILNEHTQAPTKLNRFQPETDPVLSARTSSTTLLMVIA